MTADTDASKYLSELRMALSGMTLSEREEIVDEIRAHIRERSIGSGITIAETLSRLGPAAALARDYNNGVLLRRASHSRSPWFMLRTTYHWARTGTLGFGLFLLAFYGYVAGGAFVLCAFLKPLFPEQQIGLWIGPHGVIAGLRPGGAETEILGPWFIPGALLIGLLFLIGTTASVRVLLPRLKQSTRLARLPDETGQLA